MAVFQDVIAILQGAPFTRATRRRGMPRNYANPITRKHGTVRAIEKDMNTTMQLGDMVSGFYFGEHAFEGKLSMVDSSFVYIDLTTSCHRYAAGDGIAIPRIPISPLRKPGAFLLKAPRAQKGTR